MKRKILATLSVLLILGMVTMGILAYLTDTEEITNVMTMGNVKIEQTETDGEGKPFVQGQSFYPNTSIEKVVTVTNTGSLDAYVRTWFAFEKPLDVIDINGEYGTYVCDEVIDGTSYAIYVLDHGIMNPGDEVTSLESVSMKATATNESVALFGDEYKVLVLSQAVQAGGFEGATDEDKENAAWAATFGIASEETHPWV